MKKKSLIIALPMMLALALTGCTKPSTPPESASVTSTPATSQAAETSAPTSNTIGPENPSAPTETEEATSPQSIQAMEALNTLVVADESASDSYDRDNFNHWVSKNSTPCDTRFAVLVEESTVKTKISGCTVISGNWISVYDGKTITDPKTLDIDHMVPLKEAWESGASQWDAAKRESFANDMTYADSLVAVTASSNRSKSDRDPAGYLPTDVSNRCSYVAKWITVKTNWNLAIDAQEKAAIQGVLNNCGSDTTINTSSPAPVAVPAVPVAPAPEAPVAAPPVAGTDGNDPKYTSCSAALAGGFGPYSKGEPEYEWYRDGDGDGTVCEK